MKPPHAPLSVVILAYNEEEYLPHALDSIAAQTVAPDEVIVIDNNSTDRTAEIARSYPFVRLVNEPQKGIAPARDRGFAEAKGPLLARIDADTVLPPDWVKNAHTLMDARARDFIAATGPGYVVDIWPAWLGHLIGALVIRYGYFWGSRIMFGAPVVFGSSLVLTRAAWDKIKHETCRDSHKYHEDADLAVHLVRYGHVVQSPTLMVGVAKRGFIGESPRKVWWRMTAWVRTAIHARRLARTPR